MPPAVFLLGLFALTTLGVYGWGRRRWPRSALRSAIGRCLECAGLWTIFYMANVGVGVGVALVSRTLGGPFVSVYWALDLTLAVLSLLQALVFQGWRDAAHGRG